ncbi:Cyclic nucleotide-binding domain-containing protein 2 [Stylophora pistillata]|uniref:Cyclic nucleotide-binding domain-containing protein 2 n=2 Tax=Stylophora pistillata TaxID=50429 RepID=A0A2B4S1I2_STYPI|nr:Cyclic nucleotide-binding domain-containing protein 2 [Stylophora pistillata]
MAIMLDGKGGNQPIKECWNETSLRTPYYRSQSESLHANEHEFNNETSGKTLSRNLTGRTQSERESREIETSTSFPRISSDPSSLVDLPLLAEEEQIGTKLRKTVSSDAAGLEKLVHIDGALHKTSPRSKQDQKWLTNQVSKKGRVSRRASLPSSYLGDFLSVNNIRKRAIRSTADDADDGVVSTNTDGRLPSQNSTRKAKNAGRKKPIERFRKIVQLLCFLLKMKTSMDRKYRSQNTNVFAELDAETVTSVDCDGMIFDPTNFKAVREVQLSQEAIHILSLSPGSRTEEQLQTALVALKTSVAAFGEYPLKMQRRLVSAGWYERFEAKRVIIRQGHTAENFYFILSGTALVTLLVNDAKTREQRNTTVAVLGKGSSLGELALLHHKTRSATVLCKDEVSLLAVCREDFRDIFMSYEDGREPEHIRFLRGVPYLKDLPLDDLTTKHDVCIFHYFRRGVVIVNESKTKWIYVVKTGSCRVLTHLCKKTAKLKRSAGSPEKPNAVLPVIPVDEVDRRKALYTAAGDRIRSILWSPEIKRPKTEPSLSSKNNNDLTLPALVGEPEKFKKTAKNVTWMGRLSVLSRDVRDGEEHREKIERLHRKISNAEKPRNKTPSNNKRQIETPEADSKNEQVVVQIELLKPKDQFGLSVLLFDNPAVKCHLVSNGAECVLIKKSWFLQHATEATLRKLRNQIPPYPSQATLEQKMQDQANWDSFKTQTINSLLNTLHL